MAFLKRYISEVGNWVKKHPFQAALLLIILIIGAFLRLYRISEYMTFLGDEGRDALIVRRLLVNFDLILVGPGTSVGNMYLGPIYYYMMAPALLLSGFSPAGPSIQIALLGVATIFFIWYVANVWFGRLAAFLSASIYAISPVVIYFSRSSWNPNIMPFFALMVIYSLWVVWRKREWKWILATGIAFAITLQSHYMALLLTPVVVIFWLSSYIKSDTKVKSVANRYTLAAITAVLFLTSSLIVFDARHDWRNFTSMFKFFRGEGGSLSYLPVGFSQSIVSTVFTYTNRLLTGSFDPAGRVLLIIMVFAVLGMLFYWKRLNVNFRSGLTILLAWIIFALIGMSLYKSPIYDHYYGFLFPAPFLLLGAVVQYFLKRSKILGMLAGFILLLGLTVINIKNNPFRYPPNRQMQKTIEITQKMVTESEGKPFNIAVIAERNYEGAYQYFLELWNANFIIIDPQRAEETTTDQLFVVCEYEESEKCQPTSNPKAEIANYGWSKIEKSWEVAGVVLYKLIPNPPL